MVMPGVMTRKPREKVFEPALRAALTACQAISIAITVVLPAPVASFSAIRNRSGFAPALACRSHSRKRRPRAPAFGATSCSQIAVSTASTWQKNGRTGLGSVVAERAPVAQERGGDRRDLPLLGVGERPPVVDLLAQVVDDRRGVVFLRLRREAVAGVEDEARLLALAALVLRLRDRRDQLGLPPALDDPVGRQAVGVELPVRPGLDVRGVQDGLLEEGGHCRRFLSRGADNSRKRSAAQPFAAAGRGRGAFLTSASRRIL